MQLTPAISTGALGRSTLKTQLLPDDVLYMIFSYFTVDHDFIVSLDGAHKTDMTWLRISHVCSHWRTLFVGCPWAPIIFVPFYWTRICLKRAKKAPLSIEIDWFGYKRHGYPNGALVKEALHHIPHTRILALRSIPAIMYKTFVPILQSQPADILQELSFCAMRSGWPNGDIEIPDDIFNGQTPNLRKLSLTGGGLSFKWENYLFSNPLTHLSLSNLSENAPTINQLLAVLSKTSATLVDLQLKCVLPSYYTRERAIEAAKDKWHGILTFPALKTLTITDRVEEVSQYVRHMRASPHLLSEVHVIQSANIFASLPLYALIVSTLYAPHTDASVIHLNFVYQEFKALIRWTVKSFTNEQVNDGGRSKVSDDICSTSQISFQLGNDSEGRNANQAFATFTSSFPYLSSVRSLSISAFITITASSFSGFLDGLTNLLYLSLYGPSAHGIIHALADAGPQALPRLKEMTLKSIDLTFSTGTRKLLWSLETVLAVRKTTIDPFPTPSPRPASASQSPDSARVTKTAATLQTGIRLVLQYTYVSEKSYARLSLASAQPIEVIDMPDYPDSDADIDSVTDNDSDESYVDEAPTRSIRRSNKGRAMGGR